MSTWRRLRNKIKAVLHMGGRCQNCDGEFLPSQYDFHHIWGRTDESPSDLMKCSWDKIEEELKNCEMLCANCHRLKHHEYNNEELTDAEHEDNYDI